MAASSMLGESFENHQLRGWQAWTASLPSLTGEDFTRLLPILGTGKANSLLSPG